MVHYINISAALFLGLFQQPAISTHNFHVASWKYEVSSDHFDKTKSCRLFTHRIAYAHHTLTFQLGPQVDTANAEYRIDDRPAVVWRSNAMALASLGVTLQDDALRNPSGGGVPIAESEITGAHRVTLRASPRSRLVTFDVSQFANALAAAKAAGCPADRFY